MGGPESQLLFLRSLVLMLLYAFVGLIGWIAWRELKRTPDGRQAQPAAERLVVLDGGETGWPAGTLLPVGPLTVVGRDLGADVVLADATLSGRHATLMRREGDWWLEDLHSTNGTYLNGNRLVPEAPALLRSGDVVQFGALRTRWVQPES